ncbi:MAG: SLBB domain-containing protein [Candidatus Marinimicrobia bacterium]|jgi:protein involved in polysaccharide export with SLBB domain|nr:SLBB domain-containing protein [Candidatus Neomarinimicrobiota bacterium]MDP7527659.1 SLBB domain-containing protein [Candidatus Neomarinimicrobiota bacterium]
MNIRIIIITIILFSFVGNLFSQSVDELKKIQQAYEEIIREKMAKEAISEEMFRDDILIDKIPTQILVKPDDIITYYVQKMSRIRTELDDLKDLLPLISKKSLLPYYGYDFFYSRDSISFWQNSTLPDDYPLGAGDEIIISLWGAAENRIKEVINRDGTVFAQNVGLLYLGGKTKKVADDYINNEFKKMYSTMRGNNPTTFLDVTLGKLKGINIQLTGAVLSPGIHAVNPFSKLTTVLMQAGGIDTTGSLREITIIRNDTPVDTLDLYALLHGTGTFQNFRLLDWDRIHIPTRRTTVAVEGAVKRPAYYESLPNETLQDLLSYCGGLQPLASDFIVLTHNNAHAEVPQIISTDKLGDIEILDGDNVFIPTLSFPDINVSVSGAVPSPGSYPWFTGITLKDLLLVSGSLKQQYYDISDWEHAELARYDVQESKYSLLAIDIPAVLNGSVDDNIQLSPYDRLMVPKHQGLKSSGFVTVVGSVYRPGEYALLNVDEHLESVLTRSGGLLPGAFKAGITIERDTLLLGWSGIESKLKNRDVIRVPDNPHAVTVLGEVHNPGYFTWKRGKPLRYYLRLAGGLTSRGDKQHIFVKYANGEGASVTPWRKPEVRDGATITVSEMEIYKDKTSGLEILQTLAGTAGSLATVILIINSQR